LEKFEEIYISSTVPREKPGKESGKIQRDIMSGHHDAILKMWVF
jgi:hypothetical protein